MGWWIALAVLVGLAILPLGVRASYRDEEPYLAILLGAIPIRLYPQRKKKEKPPKKSKKQEVSIEPAEPEPIPSQPEPQPIPKKAPDVQQTPQKAEKPRKPAKAPAPTTEQPKESITAKDWLSFLPMVLDFLGEFRRKLRVNRLELRVILAGGDPCDLAVNYGRAWAAMGNLIPLLEWAFVIQKRDVEVECDFTASKIQVYGQLDLTITLGRLVALAVKFAIRAFKQYQNMKKSKGGAVQ